MDGDGIVEVWLTNGKRYRGRIADPERFCTGTGGDQSLVLCEEGRFFVWIHRRHITRVRTANARLGRFVAPVTDQVA